MNCGIDLEGKLGVVTGASSGIGRAIAIALAAEGMKLLLLGRNTDALRETAEAADRGSGELRVIPCDLGDDHSIREAGDRINADFPSVDVLVHSAGILEPGEILSTPVEVLDRHYQINVRAPYLLTRTLLPAILERQGQIVFINSSISRQKGGAMRNGARTFQSALRTRGGNVADGMPQRPIIRLFFLTIHSATSGENDP